MKWDPKEQRPGHAGIDLWLSRGLECRSCEAVCELVVFPWRCLKEGRSCIYAFEEDDCVRVGCVHKVFSAEFDLAAFCEAGSRIVAERDPYGAVRAARRPRAECGGGVERSIGAGPADHACIWGRTGVGTSKAARRSWDGWSSSGGLTDGERD